MISIITPVYNGENYIAACMNVVIEQKCSNVEHIIVDGGSSDRTVEIIKNYASKYPHISWISEPDRGQSDAMNKGIKMAKGDILAVLNVDDYYEPNVLNDVLTIFKILPEPSFVVGNCNIWGEEGKLIDINKPKRLKLNDLLIGPHINPFPMNPSAYFYHTSLHEKIGLYKVDEHYAMDVDFLFKAMKVVNVKYVNKTWGNYRKFEGTKTVDDIDNGQNMLRINSLMEYHLQQLPLFQRWLVILRRKLNQNYNWIRFKYFIEHPYELFPSVKKKLVKSR